MVGNAQVKQLSPTNDLDKIRDLAPLRYTKPSRRQKLRFAQSRKVAKDQLRFWLSGAGLFLYVLYIACFPQEVLDTEKRLEGVLPERRADT